MENNAVNHCISGSGSVEIFHLCFAIFIKTCCDNYSCLLFLIIYQQFGKLKRKNIVIDFFLFHDHHARSDITDYQPLKLSLHFSRKEASYLSSYISLFLSVCLSHCMFYWLAIKISLELEYCIKSATFK